MKLVPNASQAWKWISVQAMAASVAIQAAWLNLPPDLAARVPDKLVDYGTIALLILGIVGRLVDQGAARE